jgi:immunity protein Imm5 of predicted polymorphic toxin system
MLKQFTAGYYLSHRGCYSAEKMQGLVDANPHTTIQDFLSWPISLKDKFYFVRNYTELTIKDKQELALMCAKVSLKIYEAKYPNDKRVSDCIDGIQLFIDGSIIRDELMTLRNAAAAAADAAAAAYADAAAAADAAAYADAAAAAAAAAAAYAADAAADAAYAADADANTHTNNLLNALRQFCETH